MPPSLGLLSEASSKERPPRLARSPHPYHRRSESLRQPGGEAWAEKTEGRTEDTGDVSRVSSRSDSGTEHEESTGRSFLALPAPTHRPRKGLRQGGDVSPEDLATPLPTPYPCESPEDRTWSSATLDYFQPRKHPQAPKTQTTDLLKANEKRRKRRRAEFFRRSSECALLSLVAFTVFRERSTLEAANMWKRELYTFGVVLSVMYLLNLYHLFLAPILSRKSFRLGAIRIPTAFDPAPFLYPAFVPLLVALSVAPRNPAYVLPNLILGLSALPVQLSTQIFGYRIDELHWLVASLPLAISQNTDWLAAPPFSPPYAVKVKSFWNISDANLQLLFPLHTILLSLIQGLTRTSLLSAEHQLLSVGLINLLLLSRSPQAKILALLMWVGTMSICITCGKVLQWNVALERIPSWRLRRAGRVVTISTSFVSALTESLNASPEAIDDEIISTDNSLDAMDRLDPSPLDKSKKISLPEQIRKRASLPAIEAEDKRNLDVDAKVEPNGSAGSAHKRRQTLSTSTIRSPNFISEIRDRLWILDGSSTQEYFLKLTENQVEARKWMYPIYAYLAMVALILAPIRLLVQYEALSGQEPFAWAINYLFGDSKALVSFIDHYVPLLRTEGLKTQHVVAEETSWFRKFQDHTVGRANLRLVLFGYWAAVIATGILIVLRLSPVAEVDTRRKVFHGTMVVMLLPTTYIDPAFLSLGLALVLAVFLLLELIRATQLRPLSRPLAQFLAPYVDGRDHRGPIVISHIFLLIGCAIPLWLSLAGTVHVGEGLEKGWEVSGRDVSMVAGVVCVGMGDAAASLVGRRFGRHKWPWAGGKSLEGSAAFVGAVASGLAFAKFWLWAGGWRQTYGEPAGVLAVALKATAAASGASLTEAVLTGCNDNVVVPVVLWLLVRGLEL